MQTQIYNSWEVEGGKWFKRIAVLVLHGSLLRASAAICLPLSSRALWFELLRRLPLCGRELLEG